jgi:Tol biopolymer transport system component
VRQSVLATLCALTGALIFTCAAAQASSAPEPCPNAQLRTEQPIGLLLPDCRAYEQVSPVDKNDSDILTPIGKGDDLVRASVSGEAITYNSYGSFADPAGARAQNRYVSRRGAGSWSTQNITPPYLALRTSNEEPYPTLVFTPELSMGVVRNEDPLTSDATAGENLYLADIASGSYQLVGHGVNEPEAQGASTDLSHIVFTEYRGTGPLYEWVGGQLSKVDVANDGSSIRAHVGGMPSGSPSIMKEDRWHAVSEDGLRVFFTDVEGGTADYEQLYVRENPEQLQSALGLQGECTESGKACTVEVSASQRAIADLHGPQRAEYQGASVDGSKVFFDSRAELTEDANTGKEDNAANLYEYDLKSGVLTDLTVDTNAGDLDGAAVLGMVTAGEDGSYVYYVADGVLASGAAPGNCAADPEASPVGATCNLYVQHYNGTEWTPPVFIATLAGGDFGDWLEGTGGTGHGGPASNTARVTPDGTHLAFLSGRSPTGYDYQPAELADCVAYAGGPSIPCSEVFSFDATQPASPENPVCVSCNPSGARPVGPSRLSEIEGAETSFYYTTRNFSEDGSRLFFESRDALVPHDSNGRQDVYEYEGGHVYLISNGAGSYDSSFLDASPSGDDVFIATADRLVTQDRDSRVDVYDARVDGGFPASVSPTACDNGDSCKGPVSPQPSVFGAPASATFSGAGNLAPVVAVKPVAKAKAKPKGCKKGFVKKHGKCVKKKRARKSSRHSKKGRK